MCRKGSKSYLSPLFWFQRFLSMGIGYVETVSFKNWPTLVLLFKNFVLDETFWGKYTLLSWDKCLWIVYEFRGFSKMFWEVKFKIQILRGKNWKKSQNVLFLFGLIVHSNDETAYYEYNHSFLSLLMSLQTNKNPMKWQELTLICLSDISLKNSGKFWNFRGLLQNSFDFCEKYLFPCKLLGLKKWAGIRYDF